MFRIVKESQVLDVNSSYSYLLWSKYFSKTSIIATCKGKPIGFVSGFLQPDAPDTLFVWQVAVDTKFQGHGLATKLIRQLIDRVDEEESVQFLEATVTPSNLPSSKLFQGLAEKHDTDCAISECFGAEQFPDPDHEAEMTYRIGPLK
jgi:L-2,4-diaminobutyric acid acetyltransferase